MAERIRAFDWARHPLGPVQHWPQSLKTAIAIMLAARCPMWLGWGKPCYFFCNDACLSTLGNQGRGVLGEPASAVWREIWCDIGPRVALVWDTGRATRDESLLLFLEHRGCVEETYHTFSCTPVPDDRGATGGLLCIVTENTQQVVGERHLNALRTLAAVLAAETTERGALDALRRQLARESTDLPFALVYRFDEDGARARLACAHGVAEGSAAAPAAIEPGAPGETWPAGQLLRHASRLLVRDLAARFNDLPCAPWRHPPREAVVLPLGRSQGTPLGFVVAGLNPHRPYDPAYRSFLELLAAQIAAGLALTRALDQQRQRADALVDLSHARTALFANASHDFERVERALRESEKRAQTLMAMLPAGVYACDADGRITFFNKRAAELWGREPLLNNLADRYCPFQSVILPDGRQVAPDHTPMATAVREGKAFRDIELKMQRANGTMFDASASIEPMLDPDGRPAGAIKVFHDVSERVRAANALRDSEARLRLATATGKVGIWDWDITADRVEWTDSLFKIHGVTPQQFDPTLEGFTALVHPEDRPRVSAALRDALDADTPLELEFRTLRPDGEVAWIMTNAVVVRAAGRPARMLGAALDVTDLKRSERALRDADQRKDEFLATLAHELRNPLAPIRNALQVLSLNDAGSAASAAARDMMTRQLGHMVHLIDDLLDLSRITRGKIRLRNETVDMALPVSNALEASQSVIARHGHRLTTSLAAEPLRVRADVTRLGQVFANLLNNAAKYTEAGGAIHVAVARAGDEAVFTVKDSGVGIPPAMQSEIFEMFTQVDRSLGRSEGGLGIGLAIARRLVEMHGGTIEVWSAGQDLGSEFTVRLPLAAAAEPALTATTKAADEGPLKAAPKPARKVLVVDDNRDAADSLAMMLETLGHDTATAYDGLEAVEAAGARRPDIVLLDIGMPRLNGYDACRRIRQGPGGDAMVIVALTGWGQAEDRRRSREAGFDHHLVKPVEPEALESILLQPSQPAAGAN